METISLARCQYLLPEDLIIVILLRLPVLPILRFSAVCREWCTVIRSKRFIDDHNRFHQVDDNRTSLVVFWSGNVCIKDSEEKSSNYGCSWFRDGSLSKRHEVVCGQIPLPGEVSQVRGPCNGIFLLRLEYSNTNRRVLWNPTTGTLSQVPDFPSEVSCYSDIGFGIDPLTGDLQIVVLNFWTSKKIAFAVYNSRYEDHPWRLFEDKSVYDHGSIVRSNCHGRAFANGFCYWVKYQKNSSKYSLLEFDTRTDLFQEIEVPVRTQFVNSTLDLYDGVLCLLTYEHCYNGERSVGIWLMKERGHWTKLSTVFMPFDISPPYGICEGNKILATKWTNNRLGLIAYDPISGDTIDLGFERQYSVVHKVLPCLYKQSLARL